MANILFITGDYLPFPSSNGICVQGIADVLVRAGHSVYLLTINDALSGQCKQYNNIIVYYVYGENNHISAVRKLFSYCEAAKTVNSLYLKATEIIRKHNIEKIVCAYRPAETIVCGMKLAKKYNDCKLINYFMDLPTDVEPENLAKKMIYIFNSKRFLRQSVSKASATISFESYYLNFEKILRKTYKNKVIYAGMPKLIMPTNKNLSSMVHDTINIVYAGRLYPDFREPDYALDFLRKIVLSEGNIYLHFYSWGCEENLKKYKSVFGEKLVLHGKVDPNAALEAINSADIILNISNNLPNQVASKVMEYFSTGKPVLNVRFRKDDPGNTIYEIYPLIYNINKYDRDSNTEKCLEFIQENAFNHISYNHILQLYHEHTPEFTADLILNQ